MNESEPSGPPELLEPLLGRIGPDLYRRNPFRVLGVPVDAEPRRVKKQVQRLQVMSRLSTQSPTHDSFDLRGPTESDVLREALRRLEDPELRLVDEIFWFWPRVWGSGEGDEALHRLQEGDIEGASALWLRWKREGDDEFVARHNLAILAHATALDLEHEHRQAGLAPEQIQECQRSWIQAFKRWREVLEREAFWSQVTARIHQLDDPRLTIGFARELRDTFPVALLSVNARMAVLDAEAGDHVEAERQVAIMRLWHDEAQSALAELSGEEEVVGPLSSGDEGEVEAVGQVATASPEVIPPPEEEILCPRCGRPTRTDVMPGHLWCSWCGEEVTEDAAGLPHESGPSQPSSLPLADEAEPDAPPDLPPIMNEALQWALSPLRKRVYHLCRTAEPEADADPVRADRVTRQLLEHAEIPLSIVDAVLPPGHPLRDALHDEVALRALACQIPFGNRTEDWETSLNLLQRTLPLAVGEAARNRIESNLEIVRSNAESGNNWCGPGYYELPADLLEQLEEARTHVESHRFDEGLEILAPIAGERSSIPLSASARTLVLRAVAYSLHARALSRLNESVQGFDDTPKVLTRVAKRAEQGKLDHATVFHAQTEITPTEATHLECMSCGEWIFSSYVRLTYNDVPVIICTSCGKKLDKEQDAKRARARTAVRESLRDLVVAHRLDPRNRTAEETLDTARDMGSDLGAEEPEADLILIELGLAATPDLIAALSHPKKKVRETVVGLLEGVDRSAFDSEAARAEIANLVEELQASTKARRERAAWGLGVVAHPDLVEPLSVSLKDKVPSVRLAALEALGRIGDARAVPAVLECLADSDSSVRTVGENVLSTLDPNWPESPAVLSVIPSFVSSLLAPDLKTQEGAAWALEHYADGWWELSSAQAAVGEIDEALQGADSLAAMTGAIRAAGLCRRHDLADSVLDAVEAREPELRLVAVEAVGNLGEPRGIPLLARCLVDSSAPVRDAAAIRLESIDPDWGKHESARQALPDLVAGLVADNRNIRAAAGRALRCFPAEWPSFPEAGERIEEVASALRADSPKLRAAAVRAVETCRRVDLIDSVAEVVDDPEPKVRKAAIRTLTGLGDRRGITALVRALVDPEPAMRERAAKALGKLDAQWNRSEEARAAVPALTSAGRARPREIADAALEALREIDARVARKILMQRRLRTALRAAAVIIAILGFSAGVVVLPYLAGAPQPAELLYQIGVVGEEDVVERAAAAAASAHSERQSSGLRILLRMSQASALALDRLIGLLEHEDLAIRRRITNALESYPADVPGYLDALISLVSDSGSVGRPHALWVLSALGPEGETALPALEPLLSDPDPRLARRAREAFWAIGSVRIFADSSGWDPTAPILGVQQVASTYGGNPQHVAVASGGRLLVKVNESGMSLWDPVDSTYWRETGQFGALALSADGSLLAVATQSGRSGGIGGSSSVSLWNARTGERLRYMDGSQRGNIEILTFSQDGSLLASGGEREGSVRIWDSGSGALLREARVGVAASAVRFLAFSPDGRYLAVGTSTQIITLVTRSGAVVGRTSSEGTFRALAFPSVREVVVLHGHGGFPLIERLAPTGLGPTGSRQSLEGRNLTAWAWWLDPTARFVAGVRGRTSRGSGRTLTFWNAASGEVVGTIPFSGSNVAFSFSPDSGFFTIGGRALWRFVGGEPGSLAAAAGSSPFPEPPEDESPANPGEGGAGTPTS